MKLKALLAFMALSLAACSGDEDTSQSKSLDEIAVFIDGSQVELYQYRQNRLIKNYYYDQQGEIVSGNTFTYDELGRLIFIQSSTGTEVAETLTYDNMGRISMIQRETANSLYVQNDFDYAAPGKVMATRTVTYPNGQNEETTTVYFLNQDGKVSRIEEGAVGSPHMIAEVQYEGNDIILKTDTFFIPEEEQPYIFTHQFIYSETPVTGWLLSSRNRYGDNPANVVLCTGFQPEGDKYLTKVISEGGNPALKEYIYEFDGEGYPVKRSYYADGELSSYLTITYR